MKPGIKNGYTLVEILVVIAIIGVLVGLLLPALLSLKNRMTRTRCANNIKQINLAFIVFATDHSMKYPWVIAKRDQQRMGFTYYGAFDTRELYGNAIIRTMLGTAEVLVSPHDPDRKRANELVNLRFVDFVPSEATSYGIGAGSPLAKGPAQEYCADHTHTESILTVTRNIKGPINDGDSLSNQSGGNPDGRPDHTQIATWVGVDNLTRDMKNDRAMANLKSGMGQMGLADGSAHLFSLGGLVAQVSKHHLDRGSNYGGIPSPIIDTPNDNTPGIHVDWRVWNAAQAAAQPANP